MPICWTTVWRWLPPLGGRVMPRYWAAAGTARAAPASASATAARRKADRTIQVVRVMGSPRSKELYTFECCAGTAPRRKRNDDHLRSAACAESPGEAARPLRRHPADPGPGHRLDDDDRERRQLRAAEPDPLQ